MSTTQQPLPPKKEVALALLERSSVHIHLDPRLSGVVVPTWFKKQAQLVLQIGLNMPVPIPDLRLDDEGMSCTLSFNRSPFFCFVPWSSVFAMVGEDKRGMVWPDDVPPEIAGMAGTAAAGGNGGGASKGAESARKDPPKRALSVAPPPAKSADAGPAARPKRTRKKPAAAAAGSSSEAPPAKPARTAPRGVPTPVASPSPVALPAPAEATPPAASPRAPAAAGGPARKPKRELPPYLRVVK